MAQYGYNLIPYSSGNVPLLKLPLAGLNHLFRNSWFVRTAYSHFFRI
jgi:hypothetical protein